MYKGDFDEKNHSLLLIVIDKTKQDSSFDLLSETHGAAPVRLLIRLSQFVLIENLWPEITKENNI